MIRCEQLRPGGPEFYYDDALFPSSTDSFALGYFARPRRDERVCDLGCGCGLLGALLLAREGSLRLTNVELNEDALSLARRTFARNGWDGGFSAGDLRDPSVLPAAGTMDYAVCNPPYFKSGGGKSAPDEARRSAREEDRCTLEDVCAAAGRILRWGGRFALVHRPERLADLLVCLRGAGIEPKRLRFVHARADAAPSLVLIEGRRGGKSGLAIEPPLIVGGAEWDDVYFR